MEAISLCRHNRYDDLVKMMDNSGVSNGDWSRIRTQEHAFTVAAQNGLRRI